MIFIFFFGKES